MGGSKASLSIRWLALAAVLVGGAWIIVTRLSLTYDLAFFLPQPVTDAQHVLIDRMGQGPGARLLFVRLPGASPELRDELADSLRDLPGVAQVWPPSASVGLDGVPPPVLANRYLLADVDLSEAGLRRALTSRLRDLAAVDDPGFLELVAADPHLATVSVLESLGAAAPTQRLLDGETPFVMLETAVPAFDLGAQEQVLARIREAVRRGSEEAPELYGAGVYGLALQAEVRRESTLFSVAAALALGLLLWLSYRAWQAPLLAALPLGAGVVAGLATLALLFPAVHGITLAFGFTLMGVTVDYAMHVLSHARGARGHALSRVWPTLALGVVSTALAFLAFTLSGSRGLLQLGVFSAIGIVVAGVFAGFLLPTMAGRLPAAAARPDDGDQRRVRLRSWPWLAASVLAGLLLSTDGDLWSDDLASLTPVSAEVLAVDRRLRQQSGAPDIRYLVVSRAATEEQVLARVAEVTGVLDVHVDEDRLGGYQAITALVPAPATQQRRREALLASGIAQRLTAAAQGLPLRAEAFEPFLAAVRTTAAPGARLTAASYRGSALEDLVDAMVYPGPRGWVALTFLAGLQEPDALAAALPPDGGSALVDLQAASQSLLATYRDRLLKILGVALLAVALILGLALRGGQRWWWVLGTVVAALALTVALVSRLAGSLSLFDLVAATLVAGLGLDYALFFSRPPRDSAEHRNTLHALTVCFASTLTVFGLLATSSIPVLHGIGITVAAGVVVAYALAFAGRSTSPGS